MGEKPAGFSSENKCYCTIEKGKLKLESITPSITTNMTRQEPMVTNMRYISIGLLMKILEFIITIAAHINLKASLKNLKKIFTNYII